MFSGIVRNTAKVISIKKNKQKTVHELTIEPIQNEQEVNIGDSIAVDGICLTVSGIEKDILKFDLLDITINSTNMVDIKEGDIVNIERSLKLNSELGGGLVKGHIDDVVFFESCQNNEFTFTLPNNHDAIYYISKGGTVTINGVNLTVRKFIYGLLTVEIIPVTFSLTSFSQKWEKTAKLNVEYDFFEKIITRKLMNHLKFKK